MIRVTEVSVVDKPHVSHVEDLVVRAEEERLEILGWLQKIRKPNECREISLSALEEFTSELDLISLLLEGGLYNLKQFTKYYGV